MRRILVLGVLLLGTGCVLVPHPGPRPTVGPPYIPPPEPVWVVIDPALFAAPDTIAAATAEARPRTPAPAGSSTTPPATRPRGPETRDILPGNPPPVTPAGPDATQNRADSVLAVAARAALVSVDLDAEDQSRLTQAARRNLSAADSLARLAGARAPSQRNPEKLAAAQGLIRQAQEALQAGDIRAAANLAYKARLLAAEAQR
jgi:hypothetical protein